MQQNTIEIGSYERQPRFNDELSSIVSTPLSVENIDSYADDALRELIKLVDSTLLKYNKNPTVSFNSVRENEEAAFSYFGLENIGAILDHIANKAEETHFLDDYIANIEIQDRIIVPPDDVNPQELTGNGEFTEKRTVPRIKTLLFLLANRFDIDISDEKDIKIIKGTNSPDMMRNESYYSVKLPQRERQIFINDEIGNATYVFNTELDEYAANIPTALEDLTRSQINALLKEHPKLGSRLIYGEHYVANLIEAIILPVYKESGEGTRGSREKKDVSFLLPKIEESYMTSQSVARTLGVNVRTILRAKQVLGDELGVVVERPGKERVRLYFSGEQREIIKQYLENRSVFTEAAPEGYMSEQEVANTLGISLVPVNVAAKEKTNELGEVQLFRNTDQSRPQRYYSPAQQQIIIEHLHMNRALTPKPPRGYLSTVALAEKLGVSAATVREYEGCIPNLGEVQKYMFRSSVVKGYSPDQQQRFKEYFLKSGYLTEAPEGYISRSDLGKELGIAHKRFREIYNTVSEEVGEVASYRYKSSRTLPVFSPYQQKIIKQAVERYYAERTPAPEGYVSVKQLRDIVSSSIRTINSAIESLGERLGAVSVHAVNHHMANVYSPEQQAMIKEYIQQKHGNH